MPFGIGIPELFLILVVVLLLFGAKRLPEMARGLGKGITEFKKALKDTTDEIKGAVDDVKDAADPMKSGPTDQDNDKKS